MAEETEEIKVPERKVVYIEIDDEVSTVYEKIKKVPIKNVFIVAPKRSAIFQSVVNLKILKRKAEEDGKKISFVTNDKNGIYLAQRVKIPVYDKPNSEGKPSFFSLEETDEELKITPLKASVNAITDEAPTRLTERRLSISEIIKKRRNKKALQITKVSPVTPKENKKEEKKFVIVAPNRQALIGLVVISLLILLVVVYIALPGATVFITPSASVLEKSVNITLADYQKNRVELETNPSHVVASFPIEVTVTRTINHFPTSKKLSDNSKNASGKIMIVNNTSNSWPLVEKTRFQTNDGIVFRITQAVTVPASSASGPGKTEAYVVADPFDANNQIVGERGNIPPSKFFLPGLKDSSRDDLYGESTAPMTGGITDYITFTSKEDIEAAKARLKDELIKSAKDELKKAVKAKSTLVENEDQYVLLDGDGAIKTSEVEYDFPADLENKEIKQFTMSGKINVKGLYYDHIAMLNILKDELMMKKSPQKKLLRINEESTSYRIFEWDENSGKIKITANIKGIEQFDIDTEKENGQKLLGKIREHIVGKDVEEAKEYIQNLPEINKVEISSWPYWAPTIPSLPDNIDFEIREATSADQSK